RTFYPMPDLALSSWRGSVAVAVFPLANLVRHPELEALFTSDRGVALDAASFDPYEYLFAWFPEVDDRWVKEHSLEQQLESRYAPWKTQRTQSRTWGRLRFFAKLPLESLPSALDFGVTLL